MSKKRLTRAQAQAGLTMVESEVRDLNSYAAEVQAAVRNALGSTSIPPQQEGEFLENEELITKHYEHVTEILLDKAREEAERCIPDKEAIKAVERLIIVRKRELGRLNLDETDPDLLERQVQLLADFKASFVKNPALLAQVTGDDTFMQSVKKSYETKLQDFETAINELIDDVCELQETCSDRVSTVLKGFAETSIKPAIDLVKLQHERLETELGDAAEKSEKLDERIQELEAAAETAGAEKRRQVMENQARGESLAQEIADLKKKLEDEREVIRSQKGKHQLETTDLISQLENSRTNTTEQVKVFQEELQSSSKSVKDLRKDKETLEQTVQLWRGRVSDIRKETDELEEKHRAREVEFRSDQEKIFWLEERLRAERKSSERETRSLNSQLSREKLEKQTVQSQLLTARSEIDSLKQSNARQVQELQVQSSTAEAKVKSLHQSHEGEIQALQSQLSTAMNEINSLKQSNTRQVQELQSQLSSSKSHKEALEHSWEQRIQSLQGQLSTVESEKKSVTQARKNEFQSFQTQLSSVRSDSEALKHSLEKETQLLRDQLSMANDTNFNMDGSESEAVFFEMKNLFDMMEQYTGSTTEMVSMPKYMLGMTLIRKATGLLEPSLVAARRLWLSSRRGSLALNIAQAFFMQQEISSDQFTWLPWIHAALSCATKTICEKSTLTPDLAISSLWILQGLVYTATVAREWPEEHVWSPSIEVMLTQITHWLRKHVPDEASLLTMIVGQINETLTTYESSSTSISLSLVPESRRIDSANSDIPEGIVMVIDISGIIILFTADNAFVFGVGEVKVMEVDYFKGILIKFDQAVMGLPASLTEIRLLNHHSLIEVYKRHHGLLKSVLTEDRIALVHPYKRQRRN